MIRRPLVALALLAAPLAAQVRTLPDPKPARSHDWLVGGGQVMQRSAARRPIVSQFDTSGARPIGAVGDPITLLLLDDGANLTRVRTARITARRRFDPPLSWKQACDDVAHPGWFFETDAPATSAFAIAVPGHIRGMPVKRDPPPLAIPGAAPFFRAWVDSTWTRYLATLQPLSENGFTYQWNTFYQESRDGGWAKQKPIGLTGPDGYQYAVFSTWLYDDHKDGAPNTTRTWIVNAWGWPVATAPGKVDIYGTADVEGDGIEEVITSAGMIRWDGTAWRFPVVYEDEPCLAHKVMAPPPGWRPWTTASGR